MQDAFQEEEAELNPDRFKQLDELLSKADMYTQFVSEQLAAVDEFGDLEAVPVPKTGKGKRKAAGGQGGQPKKACPDTKVCAALVTIYIVHSAWCWQICRFKIVQRKAILTSMRDCAADPPPIDQWRASRLSAERRQMAQLPL